MGDVRTRQNLIGKLIRLEGKVNLIDPDTVTEGEIQSYLKLVEENMKKIEECHLRIIHTLRDDADIEAQENYLTPVEDKYHSVMSKLLNLKATHGASTRPQQKVKLPEIQLPSFDGKYEDWPSFEDLFNATVEKNSTLSPSQKLQYLKTCTKGDAATVIKSFTVTDSNYRPAWNLLKQRYSNSREIIQSIIKKLVLQPSMKTASTSNLELLLNTTLECIRSLQVLGRPTDWDDLLIFIIVEKLDGETRCEWAKSLKGTDPSKFKDLQEFMEQHIRTLHARGTVPQQGTQPKINGKQQRHINTHQTSQGQTTCQHCKGSHQLYQCTKLKEMNPDKRYTAVKSTNVCLNCLKDGHLLKECTSSSTCKKCDRKHNTFLHVDKFNNKSNQSYQQSTMNTQQPTASGSGSSTNTENSTLRIQSATFKSSSTLLKTALVDVKDCNNVKHQLRVFIDDGGEGGLINEKTLQRLGLKKQKANITIKGVGGTTATHSKWKTYVRIHSQINESFIDVELFAVPKVAGEINRIATGNFTSWHHIQGLRLADPHFHEGGEVDILLGADTVPYIIEDGIRRSDRKSPVAQNTIFGWVLFGNINSTSSNGLIRTHHFTCELNNILKRFWELEEVPQQPVYTPEEEACEKHFQTTHQRSESGKYVLRLPFNKTKAEIGNTRDQALSRLRQLESRFRKYPQYKEEYIKFMREYESLNHMELVSNSSRTSCQPVYLPHHFVLKEDSTTTKLRVVFDGSAKSSTGISLNDTLMVGATVQPDLFTLLLRFRLNKIALKADIAKMYRQFNISEEDCDYQRILWREDTSQEIQEYRLLTVTYGTASAPFLATRTLNQLAADEGAKYPAAAKALLSNMYVDDFLGCEESTETAINLVTEMRSIVSTAGMEIRKWSSNDPAVLATIPPSLREEASEFDFDDSNHGSIKALGIRWHPISDSFMFKVNIAKAVKTTKRHMLSEIAKTFDPLGWLAPVTIRAKLLLQKVWLQSYDWDNQVSAALEEEWEHYQKDLVDVEKMKVPRCISTSEAKAYELHGFCDSSELAFSSAVYLKVLYHNSVQVNLMTARTKVAPLKAISLPKLELSGAKLLAETIQAVRASLPFEHKLFCWTDSTITLRWISSHSRRWKTFVANRVSAIQSIVAPEHWHHVRSQDNPADLPSRGVSAQQLENSSLWWHGPEWLLQDTYPISFQPCCEEDMKKEERSNQLTCYHMSFNSTHDLLFNAFSSFTKLCRAAAYLRRYMMFIKKKTTNTTPLSTLEVRNARKQLICWSQHASFPKEFHDLKSNGKVSASSKLANLCPFMDNDGILRVGGRIQNSTFSQHTTHPIILSNQHPISKLIITQTHHNLLHGGFTLTHATVRQEFWILRGRDIIRHAIRKCVVCRKTNAVSAQQLMGSLPAGRVTVPQRPFMHCGVDFDGPFPVKLRKGRHVPAEKAYISILVCLATKAVHLESVNKLTTEDFIACYERFVSRRGKPAHLYSDCGTNFVGADRILQQYLSQEHFRLQHQITNLGTQWHFNPPSAPHHGGLWEAGVKSLKFHFKRVVGSSILMLDQFQTLLCKIEACLNSRPLCALSSDPNDIDALTPGHFLIGGPITAIPEPDCSLIKENRLSYWEQVRQMSQRFWKRWSNEYVTSLQQRFKWTQKRDNLQVGDLVVIKDDVLPATKWKLGRVTATHPGKDNLVRSVTLQTATGELTRPITKLSALITQNDI